MIEKSSSAEYLLLDVTQRLMRNPQGWRSVIIHLSRLRVDHRLAHHLRIASNTFANLVKPFDGQTFPMSSGDIVFLCRNVDPGVIDDAVMKVRYLFGDDPLTGDSDVDAPDSFASWYDLGVDGQRFFDYVTAAQDNAQRRQRRLAAIVGGIEAGPPKLLPMEPQALTELVKAITRADLSGLLRRQAVCALVGDEPPKPVFREFYISIADLRDAVMPKYDIAADFWLFKYLTQTLDKRVMVLLRRSDENRTNLPFSINLNVSTLLSPEFLAFDENVRAVTRGSIVIELSKVDIFADLGSYIFARDFARERGYRLCLDGMTALTLPFIDRDRLGLDLVKLFWGPEMAGASGMAHAADLGAALDRVGAGRVVLAHCDTAEAIAYGQSLGIRMFQGRHVDSLLNAATRPGGQRSAVR